MVLTLSPPEPLLLEDLCIARVGALLRDCYYLPLVKDPSRKNIFQCVPPEIVNVMFRIVVCAKRQRKDAKISTMLFPLLSSSRLTNLYLDLRKIDPMELTKIFKKLIPKVSFIKSVSFEADDSSCDCPVTDRSVIDAVKDFVKKCKSVECLSIFGPAFELGFIHELPKLQKLFIWCYREAISEHPLKNLEPVTHINLKYVIIRCHYGLQAPNLAAKFLMCCPNLISVKTNITVPLKLLHSKDFSYGTLNKTYLLKQYSIDTDAIGIASRTCPMTEELHMRFLTDDFRESDFFRFKNLESLIVYCREVTVNGLLNFFPAVEKVLKVTGVRLKLLSLRCTQIDFEVIAVLCPNLTFLDAWYEKSVGIRNPSKSSFTTLEKLRLNCCSGYQIERDVLQYILRGCKELGELYLFNVECLTDEMLRNLLHTNYMPCLGIVEFTKCALTENGIRLLLQKCYRLKKIYVRSVSLPGDDAVYQLISRIKPTSHLTSALPTSLVHLLNSYPFKVRSPRHRKHAFRK